MTEEWKVDENWCITNGKTFFYIGDIISITNESLSEITVTLRFTKITVTFSEDAKDKDSTFDWLCMIKGKYHTEAFRIATRSRALTEASVEIQNRMAGHIIHEH